MFLKSLEIYDGDRCVRNVQFKLGLNLIVDNSPSDLLSSGNDVGKTTALRAIDFCLGGNAKDLYTDKEFSNRRNEAVYEYVSRPSVRFQLTLENNKGDLFSLTRSAAKKGARTINGQAYTIAEYLARLHEIIFLSSTKKPTFRQLIGKFVRVQDYQLAKTVHFLHPQSEKADYLAVLLFLFGFPDQSVISDWRTATTARKEAQSRLDTLRRISGTHTSKSALRQSLHFIDQQISEFERDITQLNVAPSFDAGLRALESLREQITRLGLDAANLDAQAQFANSTVAQLKSSRVDIDVQAVRELYAQASFYLPEVQKDLEAVIVFHNSMIDSKLKFVSRSIDENRRKRAAVSEHLQSLLAKEKVALGELGALDAFADLRKVQRQVEGMHEEKGRKEGLLQQLEGVEADLDNEDTVVHEIELIISDFQSALETELAAFNSVFAQMSKSLYGEGYILDLGLDLRGGMQITPTIHNAVGNPSSGKKLGELSAFDLAYIKYLAIRQRPGPRFVLHDKMEAMHINQLKVLFEISQALNGQYVVAVLRERIDKLPKTLVDPNIILQLSQDEKFFRLES